MHSRPSSLQRSGDQPCSGSGKSAENYRVMGEVTGGRLEIKTSGRYTYEMGLAVFNSQDTADQALWRDWYRFTLELALLGAFSADGTEQKMARTFIATPLAAALAMSLSSITVSLNALRLK